MPDYETYTKLDFDTEYILSKMLPPARTWTGTPEWTQETFHEPQEMPFQRAFSNMYATGILSMGKTLAQVPQLAAEGIQVGTQALDSVLARAQMSPDDYDQYIEQQRQQANFAMMQNQQGGYSRFVDAVFDPLIESYALDPRWQSVVDAGTIDTVRAGNIPQAMQSLALDMARIGSTRQLSATAYLLGTKMGGPVMGQMLAGFTVGLSEAMTAWDMAKQEGATDADAMRTFMKAASLTVPIEMLPWSPAMMNSIRQMGAPRAMQALGHMLVSGLSQGSIQGVYAVADQDWLELGLAGVAEGILSNIDWDTFLAVAMAGGLSAPMATQVVNADYDAAMQVAQDTQQAAGLQGRLPQRVEQAVNAFADQPDQANFLSLHRVIDQELHQQATPDWSEWLREHYGPIIDEVTTEKVEQLRTEPDPASRGAYERAGLPVPTNRADRERVAEEIEQVFQTELVDQPPAIPTERVALPEPEPLDVAFVGEPQIAPDTDRITFEQAEANVEAAQQQLQRARRSVARDHDQQIQQARAELEAAIELRDQVAAEEPVEPAPEAPVVEPLPSDATAIGDIIPEVMQDVEETQARREEAVRALPWAWNKAEGQWPDETLQGRFESVTGEQYQVGMKKADMQAAILAVLRGERQRADHDVVVEEVHHQNLQDWQEMVNKAKIQLPENRRHLEDYGFPQHNVGVRAKYLRRQGRMTLDEAFNAAIQAGLVPAGTENQTEQLAQLLEADVDQPIVQTIPAEEVVLVPDVTMSDEARETIRLYGRAGNTEAQNVEAAIRAVQGQIDAMQSEASVARKGRRFDISPAQELLAELQRIQAGDVQAAQPQQLDFGGQDFAIGQTDLESFVNEVQENAPAEVQETVQETMTQDEIRLAVEGRDTPAEAIPERKPWEFTMQAVTKYDAETEEDRVYFREPEGYVPLEDEYVRHRQGGYEIRRDNLRRLGDIYGPDFRGSRFKDAGPNSNNLGGLYRTGNKFLIIAWNEIDGRPYRSPYIYTTDNIKDAVERVGEVQVSSTQSVKEWRFKPDAPIPSEHRLTPPAPAEAPDATQEVPVEERVGDESGAGDPESGAVSDDTLAQDETTILRELGQGLRKIVDEESGMALVPETYVVAADHFRRAFDLARVRVAGWQQQVERAWEYIQASFDDAPARLRAWFDQYVQEVESWREPAERVRDMIRRFANTGDEGIFDTLDPMDWVAYANYYVFKNSRRSHMEGQVDQQIAGREQADEFLAYAELTPSERQAARLAKRAATARTPAEVRAVQEATQRLNARRLRSKATRRLREAISNARATLRSEPPVRFKEGDIPTDATGEQYREANTLRNKLSAMVERVVPVMHGEKVYDKAMATLEALADGEYGIPTGVVNKAIGIAQNVQRRAEEGVPVIRELSTEQMDDLTKGIESLIHQIEFRNQLMARRARSAQEDVINQAQADIQQNRERVPEGERRGKDAFTTRQWLRFANIFDQWGYLFGYDSETYQNLWRGHVQAEDQQQALLEQVRQRYQELFADYPMIRDWFHHFGHVTKENVPKVKLSFREGEARWQQGRSHTRSFSITPDEAIELYLLLKRDYTKDHLLRDAQQGLYFAELAGGALKLTTDGLQHLEQQLEQAMGGNLVPVAMRISELQNMFRDEQNAVWQQIHGTHIATETMWTHAERLVQEKSKGVRPRLIDLANMDIYKPLEGGDAPFVLRGIMERLPHIMYQQTRMVAFMPYEHMVQAIHGDLRTTETIQNYAPEKKLALDNAKDRWEHITGAQRRPVADYGRIVGLVGRSAHASMLIGKPHVALMQVFSILNMAPEYGIMETLSALQHTLRNWSSIHNEMYAESPTILARGHIKAASLMSGGHAFQKPESFYQEAFGVPDPSPLTRTREWAEDILGGMIKGMDMRAIGTVWTLVNREADRLGLEGEDRQQFVRDKAAFLTNQTQPTRNPTYHTQAERWGRQSKFTQPLFWFTNPRFRVTGVMGREIVRYRQSGDGERLARTIVGTMLGQAALVYATRNAYRYAVSAGLGGLMRMMFGYDPPKRHDDDEEWGKWALKHGLGALHAVTTQIPVLPDAMWGVVAAVDREMHGPWNSEIPFQIFEYQYQPQVRAIEIFYVARTGVRMSMRMLFGEDGRPLDAQYRWGEAVDWVTDYKFGRTFGLLVPGFESFAQMSRWAGTTQALRDKYGRQRQHVSQAGSSPTSQTTSVWGTPTGSIWQ